MLPKLLRRLRPTALCLAIPLVLPITAQQPQPITLSIGAEYSNTSSHIILGASNNRRLTGLDLTWSARLHHNHILDWHYDLELRPLEFLQDPVSTTTFTLETANAPPSPAQPVQSGPIQSRCQPLVITQVLSATQTAVVTRTCGTRWTYAGGLSPLGQRFNLLPSHRLQPYGLFNAGFLVSPRDIPANDSSRFNFTFTFGLGLQFAQTPAHAWSLDYRIHHLSNRAIGDTNPGVDNQLLRLAYTFASPKRLHRR